MVRVYKDIPQKVELEDKLKDIFFKYVDIKTTEAQRDYLRQEVDALRKYLLEEYLQNNRQTFEESINFLVKGNIVEKEPLEECFEKLMKFNCIEQKMREHDLNLTRRIKE